MDEPFYACPSGFFRQKRGAREIHFVNFLRGVPAKRRRQMHDAARTGQTLDTQILLQPNKCYTVVATALPPVTEVNVQLVLQTPMPGMTPVLAVDQDSGPTAVLGKKATCYKWMFGTIPASAKVVVQVTGGSGLVAAQTYEK